VVGLVTIHTGNDSEADTASHERVLPFYEVNTSRDEIERGGSNLLEAVVQTDYLTGPVMSFSRLL